jgi:tripartite-type tricarboxylate transporter receptor subunit TctC
LTGPDPLKPMNKREESMMETMKRRCLAFGCAAVAATLLGGTASAQTWPDKPMKLVVPYAAGGGVDNISRIMAPHLAQRLKQPVVIENRPGANANIGTDFVAKAAPDGSTALMGATFLGFNRATMKNLGYDSLTDLVPVARTDKAPFVLVVSAALPVKSVAELVAFMKANPDRSNYGAVGAGAPSNLIFVKNTGTNSVQVLYKGGAAAMPDLIAGRITYMIQTASEVLPLVASDKLRALAVTGTTRFAALPNVPTMGEAGVSGLGITGWWGVFVPAKTPPAIVERLSTEIQAVMKLPDVVAALAKLGVESAPMPAAEFGEFYRKEIKDYGDIAKQFNLVVNE